MVSSSRTMRSKRDKRERRWKTAAQAAWAAPLRSALSCSALIFAVLLTGLGGLLESCKRGASSLGFETSSSGLATAQLLAATVNSGGDVSYFEDGPKYGGGTATRSEQGTAPSLRRVTSTARPRFPVTVVEEQPERMVIIGDVHGDIGAFAETLRAAELVDEAGNWSAGKTVLVQAGDIFDRGDADLEVEEWLWVLAEQAAASGGAVYHLLGNHEVMNAMGDHSNASKESFKPFMELDVDLEPFAEQLNKFPEWVRPRLAAMSPTGPVSNMLASHSVAMKVGDTLFVHGGLRPVNLDPRHCGGASGLACLENLNSWTHAWLKGEAEMPREVLWNRDSPIWSRFYSMPGGEELGAKAEAELQQVLDATGCVRMVVGHTPQEAGINSALGGRLWRTDTGMTAMIGGHPEALEFVDGVATIITVDGRIPGEKRACEAGKPLPHLPPVPERRRTSRPGRVVA